MLKRKQPKVVVSKMNEPTVFDNISDAVWLGFSKETEHSSRFIYNIYQSGRLTTRFLASEKVLYLEHIDTEDSSITVKLIRIWDEDIAGPIKTSELKNLMLIIQKGIKR